MSEDFNVRREQHAGRQSRVPTFENFALSHIAGELRYEQVGGDTYLSDDTNGDGTADFIVKVDGLHSFATSDLLL